MTTRGEDERIKSRQRARSIQKPGYFQPGAWSEAKVGPCLLWNANRDNFQEAICVEVVEHRGSWIALVRYVSGGKYLHVSDLSQLRFPQPDQREGPTTPTPPPTLS
jgi:hypothetical protein